MDRLGLCSYTMYNRILFHHLWYSIMETSHLCTLSCLLALLLSCKNIVLTRYLHLELKEKLLWLML